MSRSALTTPQIDPTPIFELFRGSYATELLTAAVSHFNLFGVLSQSAPTFDELRHELNLAARPANVLITAMRAMKLVELDGAGKLSATPLAAEHLKPGGAFDVGGYLSLAADSPGVQGMIERLVTNRPFGAEPAQDGAAFIYREGLESAMEKEASARHFTLALAGRAKNVAPHLARVAPLENAKRLIDVGGGTGIYSIACLQQFPKLTAVVWDRPEVLKIAAEMAAEYGVSERLELLPGDMFADDVPNGDAMLLSNILHDWDVPECETLVQRCANRLPNGGRLLVHDVFLDDDLGGPLPIALYSASLFTFTEGRAYSATEYRGWLQAAGLQPEAIRPTLVHCGVLPAVK